MGRGRWILIFVLVVAVLVTYALRRGGPERLVLTGVVTGDDIVVSALVAGRIDSLAVGEGDTVAPGQLIATLDAAELEANRIYFARSAEALAAQVRAAEADLAAAVAQDSVAAANLANSRRTYERDRAIAATGGISDQDLDQARTAHDVAAAQKDAADRQVAAARGALAAAHEQQDAARAQTSRASVQLGYTEIRAPGSGVVDVRAAHAGEVVGVGQPIVTLVNPDSLWVRADVEESYVDRIRLGDVLTVRLPSGVERPGTVFFRGVDAEFATQRDVSRTKRDIKTFEIRLRVDNRDRRLAMGMTAQVLLPLETPSS